MTKKAKARGQTAAEKKSNPEAEEKASLRTKNELKLEVIATYDGLEQEIFYVRIPKTATEEQMVETILEELEQRKRQKLVKLSIAQMYTKSINQLKPFLRASWGKYYFDTGPNGTEQSRRWAALRDSTADA